MQPPWMLKPPVVQLNLRNLSRGEDSDEMTILTIEDFLKTHSGKLEIYTDGSRANDGSASCFFVVSSMSIERNFRLSNKTSIHAAEMMAIKLALEWATLVDHHQLVIYSDFLDVWQVIEQRQSNKRPNLLRDLLTSHEVYSRGRKAKATLVWIPAHLGIEGNEQADIVGRDGALVESITFNWRVVGSTPALAVT